MSVYEASITNPKKQLEFYKDLSEQLLRQNTNLKERVDMYENPEDLTLMFMYCDEKAKDKIKHLVSVLKEIREYIDNYDVFKEFSFPLMKRAEENQVKSSIKYEFDKSIKKDLLEIIDKGLEKEK